MKWCLLFILAFSLTAQSDPGAELFFPVEKNHIQILPQRFEYQLIDKDQFRVGDVLIDANKLEFQLIPTNKQRSQFKLRFRWPLGLLQSGEIALKDNSGKAVFFKKMDPALIKVEGKDTNARDALAIYETTSDVNLILKEIQLYPFFKFCVHREEPLTKIYLCSKDLYLKKSKEGFSILARDSYRPDSFVEVNGRSVGNQGLVFLNAPTEFVALRALLLSGVTLEIDTRMKTVEFKDVVLSPEGQQIIVRAQGAEPVEASQVKRKSATEWETALDVERPYTYLKGEGDVPLRQEFLIQGAVRKEDVRVEISSLAPEITYGHSLLLQLKASNSLQMTPADKKSSLKKLDNGNYEWTLLELRNNEKNRRYLKVSKEGESFVAAYDIERISSVDLNLRLMYPLWFELGALWVPSLRWGVNFQYDQQIAKDSDNLSLQTYLLGARYRFSEGVHLRDSGSYIEAYYQQIQNSVKGLGVMGLALGAELKNPAWISDFGTWSFWQLRLPLVGNDSEYKLKQGFEISASLRTAPRGLFYYEGGLRYQNFAFENDVSKLENSKTLGFLGLGWFF